MKKILFLIIGVMLLVSSITMAQSGKNEKIEKEIIVNKALPKEQQDSMLMEKLTSEQIMELKRQEFEVEKQKIEARSKNDMPLQGFHIILIVMIPFIFAIFIITVGFYVRNRDSQRRYQLYQKSLELGQALPEHFFEEPKKQNQNQTSNLKKGVIAMAVGLALVVSYLVIGNKIFLIGGIIPAFVGLGFLLVHYLEKPQDNKRNEQNG